MRIKIARVFAPWLSVLCHVYRFLSMPNDELEIILPSIHHPEVLLCIYQVLL